MTFIQQLQLKYNDVKASLSMKDAQCQELRYCIAVLNDDMSHAIQQSADFNTLNITQISLIKFAYFIAKNS